MCLTCVDVKAWSAGQHGRTTKLHAACLRWLCMWKQWDTPAKLKAQQATRPRCMSPQHSALQQCTTGGGCDGSRPKTPLLTQCCFLCSWIRCIQTYSLEAAGGTPLRPFEHDGWLVDTG
eukprot:7093264-Alexandrium_andersonii.AAC.1